MAAAHSRRTVEVATPDLFSGSAEYRLQLILPDRSSELTADPFAHRSNCCTVTVCVIAGCSTRISRRVAGPIASDPGVSPES